MPDEPVFIKLSCGCEYSPTAGLKQVRECANDLDAHQEIINEAKPQPKDKK